VTDQQSAHTKCFRCAAIVLLVAAPLLIAGGWALGTFVEYTHVTNLLFIAAIGCASFGPVLWGRSDPIHDRSRYRPGGDLWLDPNDSNHPPGT